MLVDTSPEREKPGVFKDVGKHLRILGLTVAKIDINRDWGGFFVIGKDSTHGFVDRFFPNVDTNDLYRYGSHISPKILIVGPNERLSWQYHERRAELWTPVAGPSAYIVSDDDEQGPVHELPTSELLHIPALERHRLVGVGRWAVLAEVWQHTVPGHPSDEDDIIRLEDDYGRGSPVAATNQPTET